MLGEIRQTVVSQIDGSAKQVSGVASEAKVQSSAQLGKDPGASFGGKSPTLSETQRAVGELNETMKSLNVQRKFEVEEELDEVVVKIINKADSEVVRQIPTEEAVRLSKNIKDMVGMLFDDVV